jgi:glycosyltransferase involved in cell wall biosynthesis
MRIGVDASCWPNRRGYGRFARELLKAMILLGDTHEYVFFIDSASRPACAFPNGVTVITVPVSVAATQAASSSSHRSLRDMYKMGSTVSKAPLDIFFYPSVYTYFPVFSPVRKIVTIHDVIPEMYPEMVFPNRLARLFWKMKMWAALRQADLVLTVSGYSKQGIRECLKIESEKILVTSEAADPCFRQMPVNGELRQIKKKYGLSAADRYFLYVGGIGPHKNLKTLIASFNLLKQRLNASEQKLLIVGDFERDAFWMDADIQQQAKDDSRVTGIVFSGYVPDDHLAYLYSGAEALILPSFSEGFGLPAVEAMACGTPVIGSETTSLPEIVADAGLFFNPHRPEQLADCMGKIWTTPSLKAELGTIGLRRASSYSWQKAAGVVLQAMQVLVEPKRATPAHRR